MAWDHGEPSGNLRGTFGDLRGTFGEPSGNLRGPSGNLRGTFGDLRGPTKGPQAPKCFICLLNCIFYCKFMQNIKKMLLTDICVFLKEFWDMQYI